MKRLIATLLIFSTLAQADLQICPRMPVTAGSAGQFVSAISAAGAVTLGAPTVVTAPPTRQKFTSSSGTYNKDYTFVITSGSATVGATYTNNAVTFTVYATVASATQVVMSGSGAPAASGTLTKASGTGDATLTFSQVLAPLYIKVEMVGGGSGGAGSGNSGGGSSSTAGGDTTFGSSLLTANGAVLVTATAATTNGAAGGSYTINSPAVGFGFAGGSGQGSGVFATGQYHPGGMGGSSAFGGAGGGSTVSVGTGPGLSATTNSGSGGGGCGGNASGSLYVGAGGGAGGYVNAIISSPSATYGYVVGTGGAGGTAGTNGGAGGAGAAGFIEVTEYYQ